MTASRSTKARSSSWRAIEQGRRPLLAQLLQVVADAALGEPQGPAQLADRELLGLQQREAAEPHGLGEELQQVGEREGGDGHGDALYQAIMTS